MARLFSSLLLIALPALSWAQDLEISGKIAFRSTRDGTGQIYTMNADGSSQARLAISAFHAAGPRWSPDGTKLVFVDAVNGGIYLMNADGTGQTNLTTTTDYDVTWSPDGTKLAFYSERDGNGEIYVMNPDGTGVIRLTNNPAFDGYVSWSPDGTKIAFTSGRDGGDREIYVMNADGTAQTRVTTAPGIDEQPAWSPDGTKIAFASRRNSGQDDIYVINPDGTGETRLTNNSYNEILPAWSADGTKIAYTAHPGSNYEVYTMNADGSSQTPLTNDAANDMVASGGWGEAFRRIGSAAVGSSTSRTLTIENKGAAPLNVTNITSSDGQFTASPTSFGVAAGASQNVTVTFTPTSAGVKYSTLTITSNDATSPTAKLMVNGTATLGPDLELAGKMVFGSNRDDANGEIYTMNLDGTQVTRLTSNSAYEGRSSWSPDETKIVFETERDGNGEIYAMNADGSGQTNLTNNSANEIMPSWSPDGSKIVFVSGRDGNNEIYAMNAVDGSNQTRLTNNSAHDLYPIWSPDGSKISFQSNRDGNFEIYVMNADGSNQTRLTNNSAGDEMPTSWSPDGTKIAFVSDRDGNWEIYSMSADGSSQTRLTNNSGLDYTPMWSQDGTRIAFATNRDVGSSHEIYVMSPDGTRQTRLTSNSVNDGAGGWHFFQRIGAAAVGAPVSRTMTIKNRGDATLNVSNITSSDGQFTLSPTSFSLAPGSSQNVTATFTPTSAGVKYSTLTISSNDATSPTAKLMVNGTAIQPPPNLSGVSPVRNDADAARNANITATFSQTMNAGTSSIFVTHGSLTGRRAGIYGGGGSATLSFDPGADFKPGETVEVSLTSGIQSAGGTAISPQVWKFTAAAGTGPAQFTAISRNIGPGNDYTYDMALGDVDADGDLDLAVGNGGGSGPAQSMVYLNDGGGNFTAGTRNFGTASDQTGAVAFGDVDRDGDLDIAVGKYNQQDAVYLNDGSGNFTAGTRNFGTGSDATTSVALGDVNKDGDLDIAVGNYNNQQNAVYLNDGSGNFTAGTRNFGTGSDNTQLVALGDVDGDGDLDIAVGNYNWPGGQQSAVYLNDGNGNFTAGTRNFGGSHNTICVALGDVDGDGDLDVAAGNDAAQSAVYLNDGSGNFTAGTRNFGTGSDVSQTVAFGDVDGDGDLDIAVGNYDAQQDVVYLNDGSGNFTAGTRNFGTGSDQTIPVVLGDVDGDIDLDIVVGTNGYQNAVYLNQTATPQISVSASSVAAGTVNVGSSGTATFTVGNTGSAALSVTGITVGGTDASQFTVSPSSFTVNAGAAAQTVTVTFAPTSAGSKTASLSIAHNATGSPSTVSLSGTGAQPPAPTFYTSLTSWTKYATNPVLNVSAGQFDASSVYSPTVLYDGMYRMWYVGYPGGVNHRIGYATSADGLTWTKYGMVLDVGSGWEGQSIHAPSVIKDGGLYKMWYSGHSGASWHFDIGYATSPDGQTWTKYAGNPVFLGSSLGSSTELYLGTVLKEGTTYKMWYSATSPSLPFHVRYATSPDGITWTDRGQVLGAGSPGAWDENLWVHCTVLQKEGMYEMRYVGSRAGVTAIGYATSADGITWTKSPYNPVLSKGSAGSWDGNELSDPFVLLEGETHKMWYGGNDGSLTRLGYATSGSATASAVLSFGNVNLGSSGTQAFTVANAGNAALTVSNITLSGTDASQFSVSPTSFTINPGGAAQTVTVTLAPSGSSGSRSASLSIAHNAAGSPATVSLSGTAQDVTPPAAPSGLTATAGNTQVSLAWTANTEGDLSHYVIYHSTTNNFTPAGTDSIARISKPTATFTNTSLTTGTYYFKLAAVDSAGNKSAFSIQVSAIIEPHIAVSPTVLNFGNVRTGATRAQTFTVSNAGTDTLRVSALPLSGADAGRFTCSPSSFSVAPGAAAQVVSVTFSPTVGSQSGTPKAAVLSFTDNAPETPQLSLSGIATAPAITISPSPLGFGSVTIGQSATSQLTATNTGTDTLKVTGLALSGSNANQFPLVAGQGTPLYTMAPNASQVISVPFAPTSEGAKSATLTLTHNAAPTGTSTAVLLNGTGSSFPVPTLAPHPVAFGSVKVGQNRLLALTVINNSTEVLLVNNIASNDSAFTVFPDSLSVPAKNSTHVMITFAPMDRFPKDVTLTLSYTTSSGPASVTATLTGQGIQPRITVPDSLRFGDVNVETEQRRTLPLTIYNTGNDTLVLSEMTRPTNVFSATPTMPPAISLRGGDSTRVNVTFAPTSVRADTGSVTIRSNAANVPSVRIGLSGRGTLVGLVVRPDTLDFGRVRLDSVGTRTLTVSNPGNLRLAIGSMASSNPRFNAQPYTFTVNGGDSARVAVSFAPVQKGVETGALTLSGNAQREKGVVLRGAGVRPEIAVFPDSLDFLEVVMPGTGVLPLQVSNPGNDTLRVTRVNRDNLRFTASDSIFVLPPDSAKNLTVVFAPAQPDRVELGRLVLVTNAGNKEVRVRGRGIESAWRVSPNPLAFGRVRMDSSRSLSVSILNTGQARVTIDSLAVVNGAGVVELTRLELPPSIATGVAADVATVRFAPRVLGNLSGVTLRVKEGAIVQLVQVQGTGFSFPVMVVTPDSLTLGPVALGGVKTGALEIHNTGGDTLHLSQLRSELEVFSVAPAKLTLAPGSSGSVSISFRPAAEGEVRARLLYSSDDPSPPQIKLSGSGIPLPAILSFSPADTLRFGVVSLGWSELQPLVIRNRGRGTLKAVLRSESGEFAPEQSDTLRIAAQDSMQALIRFTPAQPGHRFGNLLIASNDLQVPLARLVMRGEGGGLRLEPPAINFGEVVVGSRVDTAIQVINQSAGQWIISLSATSPGFGINPPALRLEPGTSGRVQVWFQPTAKDDYQGEIKVQDRPLLNVALSGIGAEGPDIEVSPSPDFGEVAVGTVGEGTLTVKNTGRGPLRIFDLSSSRLEYRVAQEDSLPLVIPSGGDHLLQVSFTPDTTGEVRGSLTIVSNDPDEQEVVRLLNGRGRGLRPPPPCIAVTVGEQEEELYFGPLEAGEERELPLVVRNDCQGVLRVERIEADSRQVVAKPESLVVTAGEGRRVGVRLRAGLGEAQEGVVRLVSNDPDHPVVRRRWYYTPEHPCAEVLTEQLRFGPAEEGQRTALLAISNPCSARLLVDLVDEEGQLTFAEERLVVEPEQLERVRVSYAGSGGSGQVALATNDPARRQVTIPWEAQTPLQVRSALPREGATGVSRQTTAQLEFSQALRQVVKGLASVQLHILPEPLNNWRRQVRVEDYILSVPLELAADTSYRLVVVEAEAQSGARLAAPFELHFSTAAQALAVGSIAGRVLFDDGSAVVGTVFLANMQKELVGSARITRDGSFTLSKAPEGRYQLFAQEKATGLSTAYEQEVEVRAGQITDGIDLVLPAQQAIEEKMVVLSGEVIVEEAPELLADSTFAVPIHTRGVQELSGFAIQVSFNPEDVALVEVRPDSPTEKNVLYSAGGFPMFLSLVRDAGNMEFGGSLLGPAALQAPDGDGLLAYFIFRALRDPTEVEVVQVRRRTLRGEDVVSGGLIHPVKCLATDFDCNGSVDFSDFFHFADHFGKPAQGEAAHCDLDKNETVDFSDFFIFADAFGKSGGSRAKLLALAQEILGLPVSPQLEQSYPNPFNAQTTIRYQLAARGLVKLAVYDLLGQQVCTLVEEVKEGGVYQVVWDGRDRAGNTVASGVYFSRLEAGPFRAVRKMLLVR